MKYGIESLNLICTGKLYQGRTSRIIKKQQGTISKILNAGNIKPHKIRYYAAKVDPHFDEKATKVLGAYKEVKKLKKELKKTEKTDPEYQHLSSRAQAIKILVNALSYGIFIELNPEDKKSEFQVYGLDNFVTKENKFESPGKYFHPLPGVMITSGARLFLTMAEARLKEPGAIHTYFRLGSWGKGVSCEKQCNQNREVYEAADNGIFPCEHSQNQ